MLEKNETGSESASYPFTPRAWPYLLEGKGEHVGRRIHVAVGRVHLLDLTVEAQEKNRYDLAQKDVRTAKIT